MKTLNPTINSIEEILKGYKRYIIKVSSTLTKDDYVQQELIQEGDIAILKAYTNYDITYGDFHPFAISYIRGQLLNYLTNSTRTIKVPSNIIHQLNKEGVATTIPTISLDKESEDGVNINETIAEQVEDNSLDDHQEAIRALLRQHLSQLKERYQFILKLRYFQNKTIEEIGHQLGISRQAVDQQLETALFQLQDAFGVERKRVKGIRVQREKTIDKK
jgi:RNA polymerase sigma factor (sigma-70 family)